MDLAATYVATHEWLLAVTGMTHAMAHVHAGLAIYLIVQAVLRTRRASIVALHAVFGLELVNEIIQWAHYGSWRLPDTLADIALTVFWPTALYLLGTWRRARWRADHSPRGPRAVKALLAFAQLNPAVVPAAAHDGGSLRRSRSEETSR